jgi:hypothetical protein
MRLYADKSILDMVAILAEHCDHRGADKLAREVGLRVALLGGVAMGTLPLGVDHAHSLIFGVPTEAPA